MPRKNTTKTKLAAISALGGACQWCGYDRCTRALHFHHLDPATKPASSRRSVNLIDEAAAHPERFLLLCANCHAEAEDELVRFGREYTMCAICGASFPCDPARIKSGRDRFCSRVCSERGRYLDVKPVDERFWRHVQKTETCWLWTAYKDRRGYGTVKDDSGQPAYAHRASWELAYGPVPDGMLILHTCDNPTCVRPEHLRLGSDTDRMRLASDRGRTNRGKGGKLDEETVRAIRARYRAGGVSQGQLAREYGTCQATISEIIRRLIWSHIE